MPKIKIFMSLAIVILAVALIGGATLAWFTAATDPIENVFVAGTVDIEAGWQSGGKLVVGNWNPGDCNDLGLYLINEGTKAVKVRAQFNGSWTPGSQRMLIIYKPGTTNKPYFQLLTFDWNAFCKNIYGVKGPVAEGKINLEYPHPTGKAYFQGTFTEITEFVWDPSPATPWIATGVPYNVWCTDSQNTITTGNHPVKIFDPHSNPGWHEDSDVSAHERWTKIPWQKLTYIINQDYISQGYSSNQIQNVIWYYTNPSPPIAYRYYSPIRKILTLEEQEIVREVDANSGLQPDNVTSLNPGDGWSPGEDGWWIYDTIIPGNFSGATAENRTVNINFPICLDGATTGNEFQGAHFHLMTHFQAIQASHGPDSDSDVKWNWSDFDIYN